MIMAFVFVRMLIVLACAVVMLVGVPALLLMGDTRRAISLGMGCALFIWMAAPDADDRAAFVEFQAQRLKAHEDATRAQS